MSKRKRYPFCDSTFAFIFKKRIRKKGSNQFYFLKCVIKKYFPSINHTILLKLFEKLDFYLDEMWMIQKLIQEQLNSVNKCLPLGNQSSQWFALFYLNGIDCLIKERLQVKHYIRYMDDMILIHCEKVFLKDCKTKIEEMCRKDLDLNLNEKTQIGCVQNGIDFLGYRHIVKENGKIIVKLKQSSKKRMKKHLKTIDKLYEKKIVDEKYVYERKNAFYNHVKKTQESKNL